MLFMILLFALISRLAYLLTYFNNDPFSKVLILDSLRYNAWAQAIIQGGIFESGAFYQAPIYPYFLAFLYWSFGHSFAVIYIVQMLIGLGSVLILFFLTRKYFSEKIALLSSFIYSLYGTVIFFESKLLPETIAIFMNLLFLYVFSSYDQNAQNERRFSKNSILWISGCLLGVSCLIRPNMLLLIPFLCVWILLSRTLRESRETLSWRVKISRGIVHACVFSIGALMVILPVTLKNYLETDDFVLISLNGGITFAQGNNPYAGGIYTPLPGFSGDISHQRTEERYYAQGQEKRGLSDAEVSTFWFRKGLKFIKENPVRWLTLEAKKLFYFFDDYEHSLEYSYSVERSYVTNLSILPFALLISSALLGLFVSFPWRGKAPLIFYLLVQFLTVMIFYMSSRYRLPSIPVLCLFSGQGLFFIMEEVRRKKTRKVLLSILFVVIISIFSFMKMGGVYDLEEASSYGNLGTAFNAAGLLQEALSSFEKQAELDPESAYALFNTGVVLSKMGKEVEAVHYYERVIKMNPSLAEAYNNLGVLFVKWGDCSKAEIFFMKAIHTKPFSLNPYVNLITCYLMKGDVEKVMRIKGMADLNGVRIPPQLEREIQDRILEESFR